MSHTLLITDHHLPAGFEGAGRYPDVAAVIQPQVTDGRLCQAIATRTLAEFRTPPIHDSIEVPAFTGG